MGTLCVLISIPFLFTPPIGLRVDGCSVDDFDRTNLHLNKTGHGSVSGDDCEGNWEMAVTLYYSAFAVLQTFGWATVQNSHLSMIPELTPNENTRMALTSVRYAGKVISNVSVYSIAWVLLETGKYIIW